MPTLSPLMAPQVVVTTTCGACSDDNVGIMTTFYSQYRYVITLLPGSAEPPPSALYALARIDFSVAFHIAPWSCANRWRGWTYTPTTSLPQRGYRTPGFIASVWVLNVHIACRGTRAFNAIFIHTANGTIIPNAHLYVIWQCTRIG